MQGESSERGPAGPQAGERRVPVTLWTSRATNRRDGGPAAPAAAATAATATPLLVLLLITTNRAPLLPQPVTMSTQGRAGLKTETFALLGPGQAELNALVKLGANKRPSRRASKPLSLPPGCRCQQCPILPYSSSSAGPSAIRLLRWTTSSAPTAA